MASTSNGDQEIDSLTQKIMNDKQKAYGKINLAIVIWSG
jgi:hypothetical protein